METYNSIRNTIVTMLPDLKPSHADELTQQVVSQGIDPSDITAIKALILTLAQ